MNDHDIRFMQRALDLARQGIGRASPNPTVGCVVVKDGQIVGEGFHEYDSLDHAEVVALRTAGDASRGGTVYVTLEPCNFTGRTGPCTRSLLQAGVARVVAATTDPNPKVAGRGVEALRAANVVVEVGLCGVAARRLNDGFACWIRTGRPFVVLKAALTLDGQLALPRQGKGARRRAITSEESRNEVHRVRHASDALITGIGTILADDPLLTDRSGLKRRRKLLRVILDSRLRLPIKSRIVKSADGDLLVFTAVSPESQTARKLQDAGVQVIHIPAKRGQIALAKVLRDLGKRQMLNVLLEAGPRLNGSSLKAGLVDRLLLFYAPKLAGQSTTPLARDFSASKLPFQGKFLREFGPDFAVEATIRDYFDL